MISARILRADDEDAEDAVVEEVGDRARLQEVGIVYGDR